MAVNLCVGLFGCLSVFCLLVGWLAGWLVCSMFVQLFVFASSSLACIDLCGCLFVYVRLYVSMQRRGRYAWLDICACF